MTICDEVDFQGDQQTEKAILGVEFIRQANSHSGPVPSQHQYGWPLGHDGTFEFTSAISIVPDTFPVDECQKEECLGTLV